MAQHLNRITPNLPVQIMKTYGIVAPKESHWRPASCAEYGCKHYREGWGTKIDEGTDLGKAQGYYIRNQSGKKYTETRHANMTTFVFEAGQECFKSSEHKVRTGRPELYVVKDGDWRGNPTGKSFQHKNPEDWIDDFKNNQDSLKTIVERG